MTTTASRHNANLIAASKADIDVRTFLCAGSYQINVAKDSDGLADYYLLINKEGDQWVARDNYDDEIRATGDTLKECTANASDYIEFFLECQADNEAEDLEQDQIDATTPAPAPEQNQTHEVTDNQGQPMTIEGTKTTCPMFGVDLIVDLTTGQVWQAMQNYQNQTIHKNFHHDDYTILPLSPDYSQRIDRLVSANHTYLYGHIFLIVDYSTGKIAHTITHRNKHGVSMYLATTPGSVGSNPINCELIDYVVDPYAVTHERTTEGDYRRLTRSHKTYEGAFIPFNHQPSRAVLTANQNHKASIDLHRSRVRDYNHRANGTDSHKQPYKAYSNSAKH